MLSHLCQIHKVLCVKLYFLYVKYLISMTVFTNLLTFCCRDDAGSGTASTDENSKWGHDGRFEYSRKGFPHALHHARELVETFGHHAGTCTFIGEANHKETIKEPAQRGRT